MARTVEELEKELAELKQRCSELTGEGSNYRKLQVENDAHLQAHKDKEAAHAKVVSDLRAAHATELSAVTSEHQTTLDAVNEALTKALENQAAEHARQIAAVHLSYVPKDVQERHAKEADALAAKQAAELASLKKK